MKNIYKCKRIDSGVYIFTLGKSKYEIRNHGYYPPDRCVWWEAVNLETDEADFHETTKNHLIKTMLNELTIN